MKFRQVVFTLHRYVGLMVGLLLLVIGLTGSSLVFWHEIDRSLNSHLYHVVPQRQQIPVQSVLNKVRSAYPDFKLNYIKLPQKLDGSYQVAMESKSGSSIYLYLNPYTGAILGSQQWGRTLMTFIYDIHITLLAGEVGGVVVGICGILLVILSITGLILWPGWKKLGTAFKFRWHSTAKIVSYDIHKFSGILAATYLILIAFTGAAMIFYANFESAVYSLTGTPTPSPIKSSVVTGKKPISLDKILQKADAALPGATNTMILLPNKADGVFRVRKKFDREIGDNGQSRLYFDQYSGKILRIENVLTAPLATRILNSLLPLHIGSYGGNLIKIIHLLIGVTPTILCVTGLVLWRKRQWEMARRLEAIRQVEIAQAQTEKGFFFVNQAPWF